MSKLWKMAVLIILVALFIVVFKENGRSSAAAAASSGDGETDTGLEIVPDEIEPSTRIGNQRVSDETGAPLALYRVNYVVDPDTPEAMAQQYLRENAAVLHLQTADLSDLVHTFTHTGPAGATIRFEQVVQGIPVYKSDLVVHINNEYTVTYVANNYKSNLHLSNLTPTLTADTARQLAHEHLDVQGQLRYDQTDLLLYYLQGKSYLVYQVRVMAPTPIGDWEVLVDAHTGELLKVLDLTYHNIHEEDTGPSTDIPTKSGVSAPVKEQMPPVQLTTAVVVSGTGTVFDPDPLSTANATYGDPGFSDNGDANSPQLNGELITVTLQDIEFSGGMHTLRGPYAAIVDSEPPFKGLFSQPGSVFSYNRFDDGFEAVNTYYHIDSSMRYLNETLGLTIMPYQYANGVRFDPHGLNGDDNSHYSTGSGEVAFGEGGVDDAEDSDVIHHELGHGLHDWVTNGGLSQVNGLSEGIGDLWAQSYNRSLGLWDPADPPYQWVFIWDGHNEFWPGRITNYPAVYPGGLTGQIHTDGQIWSTCNMRVWDAIGKTLFDTAHWEGIAMTNSGTNQEDAANAVYQAAIDMGYSATVLQAIHDIYLTCVYVVPDVPVPNFAVEATPARLNVCAPDDAIYDVTVSESNGFGATVNLSASGHPNPPDSAVFSTPSGTPPFTSTLTVGTTGATAGTYDIDVVGMSPTTTHTTTVQLNLATDAPGMPILNTPPDGANGVPATPTFAWSAAAGATNYTLDVATDPVFGNIVYTANVSTTTHTMNGSLDLFTLYYWRVTPRNGCGAGTVSAVFSFTTVEVPDALCSTPGLTIPDDTPGGVGDTMTVPLAGEIVDINVVVTATHTWVGDLIFTLEHEASGTVVTLIEQPGLPTQNPTFGCNDNNLAGMILDDESANGPHDDACPNTDATPAYPAGSDWDPIQPLDAFDGLEMSGDWTLTVSDNAGGDTGTLDEWCLLPTVLVPEPPVPPTAVSLAGPVLGEVGVSYAFTATVTPISTTLPITYTFTATNYPTPTVTAVSALEFWAMYKWSTPGEKMVWVTADNGFGVVTATHVISISAPPPPPPPPVGPTAVTLAGLSNGVISGTYTFTATVSPVSATLPITYTWWATDQTSATTVLSDTTATVAYTWTITGLKWLTVTAQNVGGMVSATHHITISGSTTPPPMEEIYLPFVITSDSGSQARSDTAPTSATSWLLAAFPMLLGLGLLPVRRRQR